MKFGYSDDQSEGFMSFETSGPQKYIVIPICCSQYIVLLLLTIAIYCIVQTKNNNTIAMRGFN